MATDSKINHQNKTTQVRKSVNCSHGKFWGVFKRRERWGLSWRGWLIFISAALSAAIVLVLNVQPFLARTQRVDANILVVEGWINEYSLRAAAAEFKAGDYQKIFTTG